MIFRLSQKLATKIGSGKLGGLPLHKNPYADWSCHLFTADRTQYVILCNTVSFYSCLMYGRGVSNDSRFVERAFATIREHMEDDGQEFVYQRFIAPESGPVSFGKALNRRTTGTMNELVAEAKLWLEEDLSPPEVNAKLNTMLLSALSDEPARQYRTPNDALKLLLDRVAQSS